MFSAASVTINTIQVEAARKEHKFRGKEVGSDGASGSFFYFTKNKRYLVKTIELSEKDALVSSHPTDLSQLTHHMSGCHC